MSANDPDDAAELGSVGMSLLPREGIDAPLPHLAADHRAVLMLVVMQDGSISGVLPGEGPSRSGLDVDGVPDSLDALWPADVCARVGERIRGSIRGRRVQTMDLEMDESPDHLKLVFVPHGRDSALIVVLDVSAQESAYSRVHELAYVDRATTLPTREYLFEEVQRFCDLLRLTENRAAIICLNVEQNDAHENVFSGQNQDLLLKELGSRLVISLRGANRREERDHERYSVAARTDYRQYGVLLPCIESGADAESVALRLIESLQSPIQLGSRHLTVAVRAGIAMFPQDGTDAESLFENALAAMEDARNSQSGTYKFHSGTLKLRALQRKDLELELKGALDREDFDLHYLPIVHAVTGEVVCMEALLRWPQAVFGTRPIHKLIALAEHTGLIVPIGDWILRNGVEHLKSWHDAGYPDLKLALNVSAQQFSRPDFVTRLLELVQIQAIEPRQVGLEITEFELFRDALKDYATCRALKDCGFSVVVDDYGTGACSFTHFARSAVDAVKIDLSFVQNVASNAHDRAACAAITAMAHELGRKVIAEGVETADQATLLKNQGCDFLQGFLYSNPLPSAQVASFLKSGVRAQ